MEVTLVAGVGVDPDPLLWPGGELHAGVEQQGPAGSDKFGEAGESLEVFLLAAVYVEMVGVGGGDHGNVGGELME